MSKGTKIAKVTRVYIVGPFVAKFRLVLLGMIEGLDTIMCFGTGVTIRASTGFSELTHLAGVSAKGSPLVLIMIEEALLLVVSCFLHTFLRFEEA